MYFKSSTIKYVLFFNHTNEKLIKNTTDLKNNICFKTFWITKISTVNNTLPVFHNLKNLPLYKIPYIFFKYCNIIFIV